MGNKDSDMGVFSAQSGIETDFPGVVIEVGKADELNEAHRDTTLWVAHSDYQVLYPFENTP
jgi:hypothetical protein